MIKHFWSCSVYFDHIACRFFSLIVSLSYHLGTFNVVVRAENSFSSMEMDGGNTTVYCHNETMNQQDGDTVCDPESNTYASQKNSILKLMLLIITESFQHH